jgi:hypothetical protein
MNVAGQLQQIGVGICQDSFVAPLEKMSRPALTPVDPLGIAEAQILYDP